MTLFQALVAAWRLMTRGEQNTAVVIALASALAGILELAATLVVYPLISVLIDPATIHSRRTFSALWRWAGQPSVATFVIELSAAAMALLVISSAMSFFTQVAANRFAAACQERLGHDLLKEFFQAPYVWFVQRNPLLLGNLFPNHIAVWSRDFIRRILGMSSQLTTIIFPVVVLIAVAPLSGLAAIVVAGAITLAILALIKGRTVKLGDGKPRGGRQNPCVLDRGSPRHQGRQAILPRKRHSSKCSTTTTTSQAATMQRSAIGILCRRRLSCC